MKIRTSLFLVMIAASGIAATTYTITQLTANNSPSDGTLIEIYDPSASPKSGKYVLTNLVKRAGDNMGPLSVTAFTNSAATASRLAVTGSDKALGSVSTTGLVDGTGAAADASDVTGALGYTPVSTTGDQTISGSLTTPRLVATTSLSTPLLQVDALQLPFASNLVGANSSSNAVPATSAMVTNALGLTGSTSTWLRSDGTQTGPVCYFPIEFNAANSSPGANVTVYWGTSYADTPSTPESRYNYVVQKAGTLKSVALHYWFTAGTAGQNVVNTLRLNDTTDIAINSHDMSSSPYDATIALNQPVVVGDKLHMKLTTPATWTSPATGIRLHATIIMEIPVQ